MGTRYMLFSLYKIHIKVWFIYLPKISSRWKCISNPMELKSQTNPHFQKLVEDMFQLLIYILGSTRCANTSYLNNYFNFHVCLSIHLFVRLKFLHLYHKMSLIKVACYVLRVKNMNSGSPSDFLGPWGQVRTSYLTSVFHHLPSVVPSSCVR